MSDAPVTTTIEDGVAVLRFDDGKVNVLSYEAIAALDAGLDQAEAEATAVCLVGRPGGAFSAGFDLSIMTTGIDKALALVAAGGKLMLRLYMHPQPVVAAVTGHALAGGCLLASTADYRIGADRASKIGLNEASIGMSLPAFAVELARDRLTPTAFVRGTLLGEIFDPHGAVEAGWLDKVVPEESCADEAIAEARRLGGLSQAAYATTKRMLRQTTIERTAAATALEDFKVE
jgi:enoyl-CoA hydratase